MTGSMQWFRWHHGSVTDPKFNLVAKKAGATLPEVLSVWAFILETASASSARGNFGDIDCESVDCLFGLDDGTTSGILAQMQLRGLVRNGAVINWDKRQPKRERDDDNSTDRVRALRERKRQETSGNANATPSGTNETPGNAKEHHVTPTQHHETPVERQETPREEESREEEIREVVAKEVALLGAAGASLKKSSKGTRLSEDWLLPKSWGEWSLAEFPTWTPEIVRFQSQKFRDYWVARTGAGATKRDWLATWRNWCREARPLFCAPAGAKSANAPTNRQEALEASNNEVAARWAAQGAHDETV